MRPLRISSQWPSEPRAASTSPTPLRFVRHRSVHAEGIAGPDFPNPPLHERNEPRHLDQPGDHAAAHIAAGARRKIAQQRVSVDELACERARLDHGAAEPWRLAPAISPWRIGVRHGEPARGRAGRLGPDEPGG